MFFLLPLMLLIMICCVSETILLTKFTHTRRTKAKFELLHIFLLSSEELGEGEMKSNAGERRVHTGSK